MTFRPALATCLGFLTLSVAAGAAPTVRTVPADAANPAAPHEVIAGRATTLKAALSESGADYEAVWNFGDGSEAVRFAVTNARDLSVRHTYLGDAGTSFAARLTVTNRITGETAEGVYRVKIAQPSLAVSARIAVDEGLWYLHKSLGAGGSWRGDCAACDTSGAVTAANLQAFERAGFEESGEASNPYTETVAAARSYLLEQGIELQSKSQTRSATIDISIEAAQDLVSLQTADGYWPGDPGATGRAIRSLATTDRFAGASTIFNVSSQVNVTTTGFLYSRVTRTYNGTMTVTNTSGSPIPGPLNVVLTNLPGGVTLANSNGTFNSNPYRTAAVASLAPGQSVQIALSFNNPSNVIITSTPVTYSGTFPPEPVLLGCPTATGINGTPYSSALIGEGGVQPYTYSITTGILPTGLNLNTSTGAITGTPTANGAFPFTATLVDGTGLPSGTATANCTITISATPEVQITVTTVPAGLSIIVDGNTLTAPQVFNWTPGSNHTIATTTPQGSGGTRYVFSTWSDLGAIAHSITVPSTATTYTANFNTEYQLTIAASPANGGNVTPASGTFFAANSVQNITATPNSGFSFSSWTGPAANASAAATTVTMTAPISVTANFVQDAAITVTTVPAGLTIIVDGNTLTSPQSFNWTPGSNHTIATTSPQGSGGTRYVFSSWSDLGAISHTVTAPSTATTFTASFNTEYQLTTAASPSGGGTVTPASGSFFAASSVQNVSATPNTGFAFNGWTGPVASATSAATTVTMSAPVSVTANFVTALSIACPTLTTANIGSAYSSSFTATGGTAPYTFSIFSGALPPGITLTPGTGALAGNPTTKGNYTFVGRVTDATSPIQQAADTVSCSITVPNRLPTASGQATSTNEDTAKVITLSGTDPDNDTLTFAIVTGPTSGSLGSFGSVSCAAGTCTRNVTYTPNLNFNGADSFTFRVNDGEGDSATTATVTITVNAVNDPPVAAAQSYNAQANMRIVIPAASGLLVGATDPDSADPGFTPTFTVGTVSATSPAGGAIAVNTTTGELTFDPPPGVTGNVTFTYTVCDNGRPTPSACSAPALVTVPVAGPVIWFVNTAGANGTGTLFSPFNALGFATTAMGSNTNQRIFVYSGIQALGAGVTLPADGWLVGQGVTGASFDAVMGITPPPTTIARPSIAGSHPTIRGTVSMNGNNVNVRGLLIQPGSGTPALQATLAGPFTGLVVSDVPNVTGTSARAVNLNNVSGTFTIQTVNASATDIGINLSNVNPSTGSFTVTGNGGSCNSTTPTCTGGTISNVTDRGIQLNNTRGVSLTRMRVANSTNFGLNGTSVTNLDINTCLFDGTHGGGVDEGAIYVTNWAGTGTITNSEILGGSNDTIRVQNTTGSLNRLTISGSTIRNNTGADANHGLRFAHGCIGSAGGCSGAVMNLTVTGSTFRNNESNHIDIGANGLGTMDVVLTSNTFQTTDSVAFGGAVNTTFDHSADITFDYNGNTSTGSKLTAFNFFGSNQATASSSMIGHFRNNNIGTAGVANSASAQGGGLSVTMAGGTLTMSVTGNTIRNPASSPIMSFNAGDAVVSAGTFNLTATGNTLNIDTPLTVSHQHGLSVNMGTTSTGNVITACVDVGGAGALANNVIGSSNPAQVGSEIRVRQRFSSNVRLPGFGGPDAAAAITYLAGRNIVTNASAVTVTTQTPGTLTGGAACAQP